MGFMVVVVKKTNTTKTATDNQINKNFIFI